MEKGKCMLKLWWKIIYLAALGTLILNTYTMVHMDSSQRRLWKSKIRMIEKIEQEHALGRDMKLLGRLRSGMVRKSGYITVL